jgi:hypothetical protein
MVEIVGIVAMVRIVASLDGYMVCPKVHKNCTAECVNLNAK